MKLYDCCMYFDEDLMHTEKWHPNRPLTVVYSDAAKELHYCKRFLCEITSDKKVSFISESEGSQLDVVTTAFKPVARIIYNKLLKATKSLPDTLVKLDEFIDVKGMKAQGNQMTKLKVKEIVLDHPIEGKEPWPEPKTPDPVKDSVEITSEDKKPDTIEWDMTKIRGSGPEQTKMF